MLPEPMKVVQQKAQLSITSERPKMDIETIKNGLTMKTSPVRLLIRNRAFFDSIGLKSMELVAKETVQSAESAVLEYMGKCTREGRSMVGPDGVTIAQLARSELTEDKSKTVALMPCVKPDIDWIPASVEFRFKPDKIDIRWDIGGVKLSYIPYSLQFFMDGKE